MRYSKSLIDNQWRNTLSLEIMSYNATLEFLLYSAILGFLVLGVLTDLKTREVSNTITFAVLVLSIPLIAWNLKNIGFFNFAYLAVFFMAYSKGLGAADLKVLFPLLFIFKDVGLFAGVLAVFGALYFILEHYRNKNIPIKKLSIAYFVPITISFVFMVWSVVL